MGTNEFAPAAIPQLLPKVHVGTLGKHALHLVTGSGGPGVGQRQRQYVPGLTSCHGMFEPTRRGHPAQAVLLVCSILLVVQPGRAQTDGISWIPTQGQNDLLAQLSKATVEDLAQPDVAINVRATLGIIPSQQVPLKHLHDEASLGPCSGLDPSPCQPALTQSLPGLSPEPPPRHVRCLDN